MLYRDLQNMIIQTIQSKSLRVAIENTNKEFLAMELVTIAFKYARSYDQRLDMLMKIQANIDEETVKEYISHVIAWQQDMYTKFVAAQENCVYELHIKQKPTSYDEKYLCDSYESALEMIPLFYDEYDSRESALSKYEIEKRKIFCGKDKSHFDEDYVGHCTLNHKREICNVDIDEMWIFGDTCSDCCDACEIPCIQNIVVDFPRFVCDMELVQYTDYPGKKHYGVNLESMADRNDEYYIIPLDCPAMQYHIFERDFYNHEHIEAPFVEKVSPETVPADIQETYRAYVSYCNKL